MSKVKVVLNDAGIIKFLKSREIQSICQECASIIARRAGEGYETKSYVGKKRVNVSVYPETKEAFRDNLENNTLLKIAGEYRK